MGTGRPRTRDWDPQASQKRQRAVPQVIEDTPSDNPFALLSQQLASRSSAPSTQTKLQDIRKVIHVMPWMADHITDTGLVAVLHLGLDGAQETPLSSLGSAPNNTKSPSPQARRSKRRGVG